MVEVAVDTAHLEHKKYMEEVDQSQNVETEFQACFENTCCNIEADHTHKVESEPAVPKVLVGKRPIQILDLFLRL